LFLSLSNYVRDAFLKDAHTAAEQAEEAEIYKVKRRERK